MAALLLFTSLYFYVTYGDCPARLLARKAVVLIICVCSSKSIVSTEHWHCWQGLKMVAVGPKN